MSIGNTPKKLRKDIEAAKQKIDFIRRILDSNSHEKNWGLGIECYKTSQALKDLVEQYEVPTEYKVAVVGRFKAGKSSFVNVLLERSLAGENTNPETAAVTTFRYGEEVKATIHFLKKTEWEELKQLHSQDPKNLDAQRFANWDKFKNKKLDPDDSDAEVFDAAALSKLETELLTEAGLKKEICLDASAGKKGESVFRQNLKRFTAASKPHHCLVQAIEITTPSSLLDEGVLLIDTPGLGDPERFRVNLTESAVQAVDAILFLTQSGASYDQLEKDFLLTLLRKGTVKQLVFVITQIDKTYSQHIRQARDEGEQADSIAKRIEIERRRLELEIERTLMELGEGADSIAIQRYREQLGDVEVVFTSTANHRDWLAKAEVKYPIIGGDPGGILTVKESLLVLLSTESRLAATARAIEAGAGALLDTMLRIIANRRVAVHSIKNREEAERKLGTFRAQLEQAGAKFSTTTSTDKAALTTGLAAKMTLAEALIENMVLQAGIVFAQYEANDVARHWRTRRGGGWGYMSTLQAQVANTIFPRVAGLLNQQKTEFESFIYKFKAHLLSLSETSTTIAESLELEGEVRIDVSDRLSEFLEKVLVNLQTLIESEEAGIVALLDSFVTSDVADRISDVRGNVSDVWGSGTTVSQTRLIKQFYADVKAILREALANHLRESYERFTHYLLAEAAELPEKALGEITAELERVQANITAAAEASVQGKKAAFNELAERLSIPLTETQKSIQNLFSDLISTVEHVAENQAIEARVHSSTNQVENRSPTSAECFPAKDTSSVLGIINAPDVSLFDNIRGQASRLLHRFVLKRGSANWNMKRIFTKQIIAGTEHVLLIDPFLSKPHQMRNLCELVTLLRQEAGLKTMSIITGNLDGPDTAEHDAQLRELAQQLVPQGINLVWERKRNLHDRFVVMNNGAFFKLGRGLDIYKSASGLAKYTQDLRAVHECEIDVFGVQ